MNLPLNPKLVVAAAMRCGLLSPPEPPKVCASTHLRKMPPKIGDPTSRRNQAHAMAAAGWSHERIARNLNVTTRSVENYLRT